MRQMEKSCWQRRGSSPALCPAGTVLQVGSVLGTGAGLSIPWGSNALLHSRALPKAWDKCWRVFGLGRPYHIGKHSQV